jgi:HSP20 family molecular chaperone IbpA
MGMPVFPYAIPMSFVDHPHERLHQHNSFMGVLARRVPEQTNYPNHLDCDISDATNHYLLDVEVPSIKDPNAITCAWLGPQTLFVKGTTTRPWEPAYAADKQPDGDKGDLPAEEGEAGVEHGEGRVLKKTPEDQDDLPPWLLIGERRIGTFSRQFNFPEEVETGEMKAGLEAGLLRLKVPKKHHRIPMEGRKGKGKVQVAKGEGGGGFAALKKRLGW